jgi:phytoene dehydrogenase-like protein
LVKSVTTISDNYAADIIVCNADIHTVYDKLIPSAKKLKEVDKQERSSSALIFTGIDKEFPELDVHNIMFTEDYKTEFEHIFLKLSTKILLFTSISRVNISRKMPLKERKLVCYDKRSFSLWTRLGKIAKARQNILNKISRILEKISKLILFEEQLTPQLIQDKTYSYKGSCGTSTFFRHKTFLLNIKSLFLRWQCASWWRNPVGSHQQKIIEK